MTTKAKDGRETLQELVDLEKARTALARVRSVGGSYSPDAVAKLLNALDAAQAEIARLKREQSAAQLEIARLSQAASLLRQPEAEGTELARPKTSKRYKLSPVSQPEAAPEGLIRNAALQEAAAHLRDMGYWTQGAAVLSLCTDASAPTPASAVANKVEDLPDDLEVLREVETNWLAEYLNESIARLGYPVGCGNGLNPEHAQTAARTLFDRYLKMIALCRKATPSRDAGLEEAAKADQRRYHRLRVLGVATGETNDTFLAKGLVRRFTSLDEFVDADLKAQPSRGEALASTPAPASAQDELVKALAFLFDARLKATERLQQFLDTFGDLGDRDTDAEVSDWLGYQSPASTDFTDLEKFIRKHLSATGGSSDGR